MYSIEANPTVRVEMLVRRPAKDAYSAFVDPAVLTRFWLAKASGPLKLGERVRWEFLVAGASAELDVRALDENRRILTRWDDGTDVEWTFEERADGTLVRVTQCGFAGTGDEVVALALDATSGFTWVLSELKALLERGETLNLVRDKALLIAEAHTERE